MHVLSSPGTLLTRAVQWDNDRTVNDKVKYQELHEIQRCFCVLRRLFHISFLKASQQLSQNCALTYSLRDVHAKILGKHTFRVAIFAKPFHSAVLIINFTLRPYVNWVPKYSVDERYNVLPNRNAPPLFPIVPFLGVSSKAPSLILGKPMFIQHYYG